MLLFEMLAGYPPWQDGNSYAVYRAVLAGRLAFPHHFDPDAKVRHSSGLLLTKATISPGNDCCVAATSEDRFK